MLRLVRFLPRRWWSPQAWKTWWSYVHCRLETYGVYYPENKANPSMLRSLTRQFPSYYRWLGQIDKLRKKSNS
jgi:hypothetical protein